METPSNRNDFILTVESRSMACIVTIPLLTGPPTGDRDEQNRAPFLHDRRIRAGYQVEDGKRVETTGGIQASLSGRYAVALFDLARAGKKVDTVAASLAALKAALAESADFKGVVKRREESGWG